MALDPMIANWLRNRGGIRSSTPTFGAPRAAAGLGAPDPWDHWSQPAPPGGGTDTTGPGPGPPPPSSDPYRDFINNDPFYKQTQAELAAQGIAGAQQRAAGIGRLLGDYGEVPDIGGLGLDAASLGYLKQDVTPLVQSLAQKNTQAGLSLVARLLDAHKRQQSGITDTLAERGIFRSGATPSLQGREALQYKQAGADARSHLLDSIMNVIGGFTTGEQARQAQLRQAAEDAFNRQRELHKDDPPPGTGGGDPTDPGTVVSPGDGWDHWSQQSSAAKKRRVPNPWTYLNVHGGV